MLRVLNQVGRNIMLEQIKNFNMGTLHWDSGFSVLPQMAENGSISLFTWLLDAWFCR